MHDEPTPDCFYCGRDLSSITWESKWYDDCHYKLTICSCGKKNWQEVVRGSGHDSFLKNKHLGSILRNCCGGTWNN
ncbi:MAG TPA: hypothetical protein VJI98_04550 [Candidatus Nanoarchaeia archaeon]|nr:hypothetical protein [Candidatus Nanoarchaeia archaeon]